MKHDYQNEFYRFSKGNEILKCIQCGTCSASCPLASQMDHAPRELFALIRDNEMDVALGSDTPWMCVSCYQCMVRCPQEIPITDLMYELKQMAVRHDTIRKMPRKPKMHDLYLAFADDVRKHTRINEGRMMFKYGLRHPISMLNNLQTGVSLLLKNRLKLK